VPIRRPVDRTGHPGAGLPREAASVTGIAHSFVRDFAPDGERELCVDRHYLLCVSRGALRLEAEGTVWSLPPARAALITAGRPILVTIPQPVTTSSVLIAPDQVPAPPAPLSVFDLSPLARALLDECGQWPESEHALPDYATTMFRALVAATWSLAERPGPASMPTGRSAELRRALALTEARLADDPTVDAIAADVGLTARSLARRFETELGMTWRAALRRLRVLRAIEALAAGDTPVTEVAFGVGYSSLSAFNAAFRDLTGQTPTEYRAGFRTMGPPPPA
jgi:AraC-like DNA-binding protein